ncbi:MAG TPA: tryptophan synthase subunit alpha [Saprospiraceae bacterium]|nr:tryptophan synthase subunit alpha [Saprospiraceae bacterium]
MKDRTMPNTGLLNIYFTAGYPQLESLHYILPALMEGDVDFVEIGLPYSDPLADGPVIQMAGKKALDNGMNIDVLFDQLSKHSALMIQKPVYLMGYFNQMLQFGIEKFLIACQKVKVTGLIIPDLPMEYFEKEMKDLFEKYGIKITFLVSPLTSEERIKKASELSTGFVYVVSSPSITGTKAVLDEKMILYLKKLAGMKLNRVLLLGFGIQDKKSFELASAYLDGAIVGTSFLKQLDKGETDKNQILQFLAKFKKN